MKGNTGQNDLIFEELSLSVPTDKKKKYQIRKDLNRFKRILINNNLVVNLDS